MFTKWFTDHCYSVDGVVNCSIDGVPSVVAIVSILWVAFMVTVLVLSIGRVARYLISELDIVGDTRMLVARDTRITDLESRLASARECLSGVLNHAGEAHYNDCAYCDDEEAECTCGSAKYYDLARNWLASEKIEKKDV